jgi:hypothetical protein
VRPPALVRACYHEAGHAVYAHHQGVRSERVTVDRNHLGRGEHGMVDFVRDDLVRLSSRTAGESHVHTIERHLAGPAAEYLCCLAAAGRDAADQDDRLRAITLRECRTDVADVKKVNEKYHIAPRVIKLMFYEW